MEVVQTSQVTDPRMQQLPVHNEHQSLVMNAIDQGQAREVMSDEVSDKKEKEDCSSLMIKPTLNTHFFQKSKLSLPEHLGSIALPSISQHLTDWSVSETSSGDEDDENNVEEGEEDEQDDEDDEDDEEEEEELEEEDEEEGWEWKEGDPILHPDRIVFVPRTRLPEGVEPKKAYVYLLMVAGILIYVGRTSNALARKAWHSVNTCKGEKFEMIIIVVVQSATKAGAFFGAGWQEKWLMARLTEQKVVLRAKEQAWAGKKMTNGKKDKCNNRKGQPIVKEGMKTIRPTHCVTKVKIFHPT